MLLRSSTVPIPCSWLPRFKERSLETEPVLQLPRTLSTPVQYLADTEPRNHIHTPSMAPKKTCMSFKVKASDEVEEAKKIYKREGTTPSVRELFSSSGLDKLVVEPEEGGEMKKGSSLQTLVMGGGMGSGSGYNGNGRNSDVEHGWDFSDENNHGRGWTDVYYQNMIEANPNDALLLGNYAKFLKEVRGDYPKAKEYLERAILANPGDANVLSIYADLIWRTEKNADRAEGYFDQAVKSGPDDCYVLASYAKFLWDVDEDEDKDCQHKIDHDNARPPDVFQETKDHPHVTVAAFQSYFSE
ncbi:hypothetical protein Fmac_020048 [Flemingia macrophylla]|uniref:Uncharacterized protein n=1 Tax=Flemingia macrophylla TaxID=520843 RepID=A0ABD1M9P3_9FABA